MKGQPAFGSECDITGEKKKKKVVSDLHFIYWLSFLIKSGGQRHAVEDKGMQFLARYNGKLQLHIKQLHFCWFLNFSNIFFLLLHMWKDSLKCLPTVKHKGWQESERLSGKRQTTAPSTDGKKSVLFLLLDGASFFKLLNLKHVTRNLTTI